MSNLKLYCIIANVNSPEGYINRAREEEFRRMQENVSKSPKVQGINNDIARPTQPRSRFDIVIDKIKSKLKGSNSIGY